MSQFRRMVAMLSLAGATCATAGCGAPATDAPPGGAKAPAGAADEGYGYEFKTDKMSTSGKAEPPASPTSAAAATGGRLAPEEIQKVVRASFGKLRACYEEALKKDAKLAGTLNMHFVIRADGTTEGVKNKDATISDAPMIACAERMFTGLQFPPPQGGVVTVVYPVEFSP